LKTVAEYGYRMGRMGRITQAMMTEWKHANGLGTLSRENILAAKKKAGGQMGNLTGVSAEPTLAELMGQYGNTDGNDEEE